MIKKLFNHYFCFAFEGKRSKIILLVMSIFFLTACISSQSRLADAKHSYDVQNYRQSYLRLKPLASSGQPEAQYALGYLYYYGLGVTEDRAIGRRWIEKAAAAGSQPAKKALEMMEE